jgi:hypothetical protein
MSEVNLIDEADSERISASGSVPTSRCSLAFSLRALIGACRSEAAAFRWLLD